MNVFHFEPDWTQGITETLSWKTDILQSYTGAEQRISRRLTPRRTFEFSLLLSDSEKARFENELFYLGANTWLLPIFNDVSLLNAPADINDTTLHIATNGKDFAQAKQMLVISGFGDSETYYTLEIEQVNSDSIELKEPLKSLLNAGCRCFPVRPAVLTDPPAITRNNGFLYNVQIRFRITQDNQNSDDISHLSHYLQFPVLDRVPDFSQSLTSQYDRLLQELDNDTGIPVRIDTALRPFFLHSFTFYSVGRQEQTDLRRLFYFLRGRQRPIWVSSNNHDMTITSAISSGVFNIRSIGIAEFGIAPGRQDVLVKLRDGRELYARITHVAALSNGNERIALDLDFNASQADVLVISFLTLSRLESDDITIQHITDSDGLATIGVNFRGVRDELESV